MDYELIFWCVAVVASIAFVLWVLAMPSDEPVSDSTVRRLCGERTH